MSEPGSAGQDIPGSGVVAATPTGAPATVPHSTQMPASAPLPSPARLAWRRLRKNRTAVFGGLILIVLYTVTIFGSFVGPRDPALRNKLTPDHPPTWPRFFDEKGKFHPRPFVYGMTLVDEMRHLYKFDLSKKYPIRLLVKGEPYKLWWLFPSDLHLFGVDQGGFIAPLGTNSSGQDTFSRLLAGAKISLSIGLVAIAITTTLAMLFGSMAGYFGGIADAVIMRIVEFLMSIPALYLIIALRAYFQTQGLFGLGGETPTSGEMYLIIIIILSLIGWAQPARVIRGMVLSLKEQEYILSERALGASTFRILTRHVLPNTLSYVIIAATILVPYYILGEIALSYLGVGIQHPQVSWGILLEEAQSPTTMREFPWLLLAPAGAIFLTVMAFNFLGDGLRDALDPKHVK
ncbi:MAG: ABC transporter permease [Candidatus Sumerlaeaceae bacterium]